MRLYIHIPFCVQKCRYCDFLSGPSDEAARQRYLDALDREIARAGEHYGSGAADSAYIDSIFIGGGTPSVLSVRQMDHLLFMLAKHFRIASDAEITMECNPGTVDAEKLRAMREMGINRLSLGVQSFDDEELRMLGRIHTAKQAVETFEAARQNGFTNINLDLMSALPGQTMEHWMHNLETAVKLNPEHISAYSLILEEGTPLYEMAQAGKLPEVPDDETDRAMYHETASFLEKYGYHRYEISNYAKHGFESQHNTGYWVLDDYLGLGLGAASKIGNRRFSVTRDMKTYLDSNALYVDEEILSIEDQMAEFMFLGLRLTRGVSKKDFAARFGKPLTEVYGDVIATHEKNGLLQQDGDRIYLTERGLDISNYVMSDFLL